MAVTGQLIGTDNNPTNGEWVADTSTLGDAVGFGVKNHYQFNQTPTTAMTPITLWASDTSGTWGPQYGDASSRYIGVCSNNVNSYNQSYIGVALSKVYRCLGELKVSGHDHYYATYDEVSLSAGTTPVTWRLQYPQNGQTQGGSGSSPTGITTCPGTGGCGSVNTNGRIIKSVEDGMGTSPARTHGIETYVTSPGTINLTDLCIGHASGQCAPGDTYSGGSGYTHAFEIGGGATSGTAVSGLTSVAAHKLMATLSDTTFTTADLNPDANWTGVALTGANSTGVFLFGRNGTHSTITNFTAASALPTDWEFVGMAPGTYAVTVGGIPASGSPFTVSAGSNTIFFHTASGGAVSLGTSSARPPR